MRKPYQDTKHYYNNVEKVLNHDYKHKITAVTGQPGSGKSVSKLFLTHKLVKEGKTVFTYVKGGYSEPEFQDKWYSEEDYKYITEADPVSCGNEKGTITWINFKTWFENVIKLEPDWFVFDEPEKFLTTNEDIVNFMKLIKSNNDSKFFIISHRKSCLELCDDGILFTMNAKTHYSKIAKDSEYKSWVDNIKQ